MGSSGDGFTMPEMLVATVLALLIVTTALELSNPGQLAIQAHAEAADMQQRARAAADPLMRDLMMAGAGPNAGSRQGSLATLFAPLVPRKVGLNGFDPATTAREDAISITYVPVTVTQGTAATAVPDAGTLRLEPAAYCPEADPVCGLEPGMAVAVFDEVGRHDVFTVTGLENGAARIAPHTRASISAYAPGSHVARIETRSFYLDAEASQLRQYDGYLSDVPIADNVVGLRFEYYGDPRPLASPKPPPGTENCLYDSAGQLKPLAPLPGAPGDLVPLPLSMLNDGPWCGAGETQFDADLLRVRTISVSVRVQAALPELRALSFAFAQPGSARSSARWLPDVTLRWRVSPRNLSLER